MSDPQPPEPSGRDLCRDVLAAYKKRTWAIPTAGATGKRKKPRPSAGRSGKDFVGLGDVIEAMSDEQGWKTGVAGGNLLQQWSALCPELVGKVEPAGYDPQRQHLDLRPGSDAAAAQLRWFGQQLVTRLQTKGAPVKTIRVLRVGPLATEAPAALGGTAPQPEAPVKTRDDASAGYRVALAAHQAHAANLPATEIQQRIQVAAHAQAEALRAKREDPALHRDAVWFVNDLEEKATAEREQARQAAIKRARDEKAGRGPALPTTVFQRTA
ncbi:DciA family protein [Streptomyces sp. NPDC048611]|uniref:DciA family protein n=1 Tax=Streptomyces sp. NPDC048611 TaxID=3155635 RepID=UPI00343EBDC2